MSDENWTEIDSGTWSKERFRCEKNVRFLPILKTVLWYNSGWKGPLATISEVYGWIRTRGPRLALSRVKKTRARAHLISNFMKRSTFHRAFGNFFQNSNSACQIRTVDQKSICLWLTFSRHDIGFFRNVNEQNFWPTCRKLKKSPRWHPLYFPTGWTF